MALGISEHSDSESSCSGTASSSESSFVRAGGRALVARSLPVTMQSSPLASCARSINRCPTQSPCADQEVSLPYRGSPSRYDKAGDASTACEGAAACEPSVLKSTQERVLKHLEMPMAPAPATYLRVPAAESHEIARRLPQYAPDASIGRGDAFGVVTASALRVADAMPRGFVIGVAEATPPTILLTPTMPLPWDA